MKNNPLFTGCATALITPFTQDGIDEKALRHLVSFQLGSGVSALVACGTTGEPSTMTEKEWAQTLAIVVSEAKGRVPVIAGTGGNNTANVIQKAHIAKELGAAAQLCVTPYYNKTTQQGLVSHYTAIADQSELPLILYNVPGRTGLSIRPETLGALKHHPRIVAIKEATADLTLLGDMLNAAGDGMAFYSGSDEVTVPFMSLGGLGVISVLSNVMPREVSLMAAAMLRGNVQEAAARQLNMLPLIHLLFAEVNPIPVKAALSMMGLCENRLRLPLVPMGEENRHRLEVEMKRLGLIA